MLEDLGKRTSAVLMLHYEENRDYRRRQRDKKFNSMKREEVKGMGHNKTFFKRPLISKES